MSTRTYISGVHPPNSPQARKKDRLDIEMANHRAVVSGVFNSVDPDWYQPRRMYNARNGFIQQAITGIAALTRAMCHVQDDEDYLLLSQVRKYLIETYNSAIYYRPPMQTEVEINAVPSGEKYYDEMVVATRAVQRAHEHSKDFSATVPQQLAGIHHNCLKLLSPPESIADSFDIDTTVDGRYVDQPHTPRPGNWPKRKGAA